MAERKPGVGTRAGREKKTDRWRAGRVKGMTPKVTALGFNTYTWKCPELTQRTRRPCPQNCLWEFGGLNVL